MKQKIDHPLFYKIMNLQTFQQYYIVIMHMQKEPEIMISYNLLEMYLKSRISIYDMNISHFSHEN